jgi:RNA polymerase sigma factor (sigma-70 family)
MASAAPEIPVLARNQAFETLYRRYVADVYHYALALLRNPADAEDVTQTTFLNAYRAYQGGVEVEKPQHWLIKIAHNVARSRYARSSRRVREVPLDDHAEHLAVPEEERPNMEGLLQALWRLPFNQRAALVMRELEGRSYTEIADTIGVSVSAVETLIFRARKAMRTKASSVRTLAAIPLPSSLSKLFGGGMFAGGGAAAGGGGMLGVGLIVKTAVALVAGVVAAGVVAGRSSHAEAVLHTARPLVSSTADAAVVTGFARPANVTPEVRIGPVHPPAGPAGEVVATGAAQEAAGPQAAAEAAGTSTAVQSQSVPPAAGLTTTTATGAASQVTGTVAPVVSTATTALPTVPVQVPTVTVPSVPVSVPAPPPVPTLP